MRKKNENLRDILLSCARDLASTGGPETINIRTIAQKAGIAAGTVYHYFNSKEDIILALTEEYWRKALQNMPSVITAAVFPEQLAQIYSFLRAEIENTAGKLMESLTNTKGSGLERMQCMQQALRGTILNCIRQDAGIPTGTWNENVTEEQYADFILNNILLFLRTQAADIGFFLEIVRRSLYNTPQQS